MAKLDTVDGERSFRRQNRRRDSSPLPENDWAPVDDEPVNSPPRIPRRGEIHRLDSGRNSSHRKPPPARTSLSSSSMRGANVAMPLLMRPSAGQQTTRVSKTPYYGDDLSRSDSRRTDSHRDGSPRSHHYRSMPDSRPSSRTSVTESEDETDVPAEKQEKRSSIIPDKEVLRERLNSTRRRESRRHRGNEHVIYEEDLDHERESRRRPSLDDRRSPSRHSSDHHHHHSSHRRHRKVVSHEEDRKPRSPSKRSLSQKYYESEHPVVYLDRTPSLRRSHTTGGSQATSHTGSSSKRSSLLGNFFGVVPPPPVPDKSTRCVECVVCMDDELPASKTAKLKCGHRICNTCLKRSFKLSVTDPQHMPPKCCTAEVIPLKHVEKLFDTTFKKTWNRKFREYSTRNRIYCPSRRCGEWIKPENIYKEDGRKVARCGRCKTKVCGKCNGKWHTSRECPKDEETNKFLEQAKQEGWQRCHRCKAMVELKEGCNHMTCRCGAEFCMICAAKWKSCECPWFNFDAVESERLEHMHIPVNIRGDPFDAGPPSPRDFRTAGLGNAPRPRPPRTYEEERLRRRLQEHADEDFARRLQAFGNFDEDEDDYRGRVGDITGIGNQAGHFMNDDYRRRSDNIIVPPAPPPAAVATHPPPFERPSGGDYVSGVNRARGVRASSMERRLADRFNSDYRTSPGHRQTGPPPPPLSPPGAPTMPGLPTMATMPIIPNVPTAPAPPPMVPPMAPLPRRHTMDVPFREGPHRSPASGERPGPDRMSPWRAFMEGTPTRTNTSRRRTRREDEPPKSSTLAGLTGPGRGMDRVFEWATYVEPGEPQEPTQPTPA